MARRARRTFTPEFRAEAVELVRASGKSVGKVAKDLDLTQTTLREWVKRGAAGQPVVGKGALSLTEREEFTSLRKEVRVLRMERDFLKKATAFFAKESK